MQRRSTNTAQAKIPVCEMEEVRVVESRFIMGVYYELEHFNTGLWVSISPALLRLGTQASSN